MKHVYINERIEKISNLLTEAVIELSSIREIFHKQCTHTLRPDYRGLGTGSTSLRPTGYICTKCDTYFKADFESEFNEEEDDDKYFNFESIHPLIDFIITTRPTQKQVDEFLEIKPFETNFDKNQISWLEREMKNRNYPGPTKL